MRIGEVARAAGVSTRALRYYEEQGLLSSARTPAGQRRYPPTAVEQVRWIQALYQAGLSSTVIAELGPCSRPGAASAQGLARMRAELEALDVHIEGLERTRGRLAALLRAAAAGPVEVADIGPAGTDVGTVGADVDLETGGRVSRRAAAPPRPAVPAAHRERP